MRTERSEAFEARRSTGEADGPRSSPRAPGAVAALWALAALLLVFAAALQMDQPALAWTRSLESVWIERLGDIGALIGKGWTLAAVSGLCVAVGSLRGWPALYQAGLRGWVAQAVTAVLVQGLKHGIGRPRPRLHREAEFFTGPSLEPGFDSFPSGHASASLAVAAVIARYYPALAWPVWGLAAFVSLTRVVRGSHFVSDVVAGVVLGLVVGTLAAVPMREWSTALGHVLLAGAAWLVVICAVAWLAILPSAGLPATGLLAAAGALVLLARWQIRNGPVEVRPSSRLS